jgi:hypothetical protein
VGNGSVARSTRPVVPTPAIFSLSRSGERRRLTAGADAEDVLEKLPLTPAPIVPALDQLRDLLLRLGRLRAAMTAFDAALASALGRNCNMCFAGRS